PLCLPRDVCGAGWLPAPWRPMLRDRPSAVAVVSVACVQRNRNFLEDTMARRDHLIHTALFGSMLAAWPVLGAEVTPDRLANPEPGNWLMNHRTYDSQRYSPLDQINKSNIKNLKLAYAVAVGGTSVNENLESTPLAEDGFLYVTDQWGVLYKIDA